MMLAGPYDFYSLDVFLLPERIVAGDMYTNPISMKTKTIQPARIAYSKSAPQINIIRSTSNFVTKFMVIILILVILLLKNK